MLLDIIDQYDIQTKELLYNLRDQILDDVGQSVDSKKIVSFLAKVGVIGLDEAEKTVYI